MAGQNVGCSHDAALDAATSAGDITIVVEVTQDSELTVSNESEVGYVSSQGAHTVSDSVLTFREPLADLLVSKSHTVRSDDSIEWTVTVSNDGPDSADDVTVTDTLPSGLSVVSVSAPGWTCVVSFPAVTCELVASLPAGSEASLSVVTSSMVGSATFDNDVSVDSSTTDLDEGNNEAQESVVFVESSLPTTTTTSPVTTTTLGSDEGASESSGSSNSSTGATQEVPGKLALTGSSSLVTLSFSLLVVGAGLFLLGAVSQYRRTGV